jgi:hypothetical protein
MKSNHPEAVTIEVDGNEYTLKLGPAAFRIAEIKHNVTFTFEQMSNPTLADLARIAYVGCLVDTPNLKEEKFLIGMANSDEGAILASVGRALRRMTDGLASVGETDEGNGKPGE